MSSALANLPNLKKTLIEDLERFRLMLGQPLPTACCRCHTPVRFAGFPPDGLFVCVHCYRQLLLTATMPGREVVEQAISKLLPSRYQNVEFQSFKPYTAHLAGVRDDVVAWTKAAAKGNGCGSLYLYSEPGPHGPGNGNGKTTLAAAAFKYVARRRVTFHFPQDASDPNMWEAEQLNLGAYFLDLMRHVVTPYLRSFKSDEQVNLRHFAGLLFAKGIDGISADQLITDHLGREPILFLDDVGAGVKQGSMAAGLYEALFNERANSNLPVFITSNFSPTNLATRLGSRAVSRVLRNTCEVLEVKAQDYHAFQAKGSS
jgi:hypothetical protein